MELEQILKQTDDFKEWLIDQEQGKATQEQTQEQKDIKTYNKAYNDLIDKIALIQDDIKKAMTVADDIQNFFEKYNARTKDGIASIAWEYVPFGIYACISSDYIHTAYNKLEQLIEKEYTV